MDRRILTLIIAAGLTVVLVAVVLIARSGGVGDGGPRTSPTSPPSPRSRRPPTPPPKELVKRDIVKGDGAEAKDGDTLKVHYVGVDLCDRQGVRRLLGPRPAVHLHSSARAG